MNMKKLFSLALLVSAFSVVPAFAVEGDDVVQPEAPQVEQQPEAQPEPKVEAPKATWGETFMKPVNFGYGESQGLFNNIKGMTWGNADVSRVGTVKGLKLFWYGAASVIVAQYIYNNLDSIQSALGLAEEEVEADLNQVFADAKCGCTDEQAEEEEEAVVEVCVLEEEEETKKANA